MTYIVVGEQLIGDDGSTINLDSDSLMFLT